MSGDTKRLPKKVRLAKRVTDYMTYDHESDGVDQSRIPEMRASECFMLTE